MTVTVNDQVTGTEVNLGESDAFPGRVRVTIYARTFDGVQNVIQDLADEYGCVEFTIPVSSADGRYAAIGTVWRPEYDYH